MYFPFSNYSRFQCIRYLQLFDYLFATRRNTPDDSTGRNKPSEVLKLYTYTPIPRNINLITCKNFFFQGFMSRFLCCRPFVLISRLSYAVYLTQFIVYTTNVATVKTSKEFTLMSLVSCSFHLNFLFLRYLNLSVTSI